MFRAKQINDREPVYATPLSLFNTFLYISDVIFFGKNIGKTFSSFKYQLVKRQDIFLQKSVVVNRVLPLFILTVIKVNVEKSISIKKWFITEVVTER